MLHHGMYTYTSQINRKILKKNKTHDKKDEINSKMNCASINAEKVREDYMIHMVNSPISFPSLSNATFYLPCMESNIVVLSLENQQ